MTHQTQALPSWLAPNWRPYTALVIGVIAVSFASIFIRFAQEEQAPSLVLAAARLWVATLVLTPMALRRHRQELFAMRLSDFKWALVSGLVLGAHFASWITSLEYTAVMNSVVLVTTNPLWVALIASVFLGEKLSRWAVLGLMLALGGGGLVSLSGDVGEPVTRHAPWLGNGLALIGAIMGAVYFVIGRKLRARLSAILYIWLVYGTAALILTGVVLISGEQVSGLSAEAYLWMVLMGLIPQLIGHSSFNYALGFLPAAFVSLAALGEPIGSGALAMIFLNEWPVALQLAGSALILIGIGVSSKRQSIPETEPAGQVG